MHYCKEMQFFLFGSVLHHLLTRLAEASLTLLVVVYSLEEVVLTEIGPQQVGEIKLGVSHLP